MRFPLTFDDISVWLGITAIILLAASELISPYYGSTSFVIEKKRLRQVGLILGVLFLGTFLIRILGIAIEF